MYWKLLCAKMILIIAISYSLPYEFRQFFEPEIWKVSDFYKVTQPAKEYSFFRDTLDLLKKLSLDDWKWVLHCRCEPF